MNPYHDFFYLAQNMPEQSEFLLYPALDTNSVIKAAQAAFMPMAASLEYGKTKKQDWFTPKLHQNRCMLNPCKTIATKTARRESKNYTITCNTNFNAIINECVKTHGSDWLRPTLCKIFKTLHKARSDINVKFVSVELWQNSSNTIVAGEFGYIIGTAYASLSGFKNVSGTGNVQLLLLGQLLCEAGIKIWDLGMIIDYKLRLGASSFPRSKYIPMLYKSYSEPSPIKSESLFF